MTHLERLDRFDSMELYVFIREFPMHPDFAAITYPEFFRTYMSMTATKEAKHKLRDYLEDATETLKRRRKLGQAVSIARRKCAELERDDEARRRYFDFGTRRSHPLASARAKA